jgi:Ca2+-binding RTX toxin-like protein
MRVTTHQEDEIMTTNTIVGTSGNDTLTGIDGETNIIYGDTDGQLMGEMGVGGNDTLIGGANADNTLIGDANSMVGPATGGNDTLIGGVGGTNTMIGDAVSEMSGEGKGGNDRLVSADNTPDNMWGDWQTSNSAATGGADTFVFTPQNGNDIIHDFQPGVDTIELDGFFTTKGGHLPPQALDHLPAQASGQFLESFSDLNIQVVGNDSVIHFDANNSVTVLNDTALTAADFHFVV